MKKNKILKNILFYLFILFLSLSVFSTKWATNKFAFLSFDETLFQLTSPIKSAESSILISYLTDSLIYAVICSVIVFFLFTLIFNYLSCHKLEFNIKLWKKKISFSIKTVFVKMILGLVIYVVSLLIVYECLVKIGFVDYLYNQIHESSFIEDNYVDPSKVKVVFPEEKRNLIYIYVESLETTYFSKDLGGSTPYNLLEPITDITASNVYFSDTDKFGGALSVNGTTWTTGAMIAHSSGLPLLVSAGFKNDTKLSSMMSGATTLGDILHDNGYNQMLMIGSDKEFGNRGVYYEKHGNFEIYDYYTAIEKAKIEEDYYVWWGFEDSKLFEFAKEGLIKLSESNEPFNFTLLTSNTHFPDGYLEPNCTDSFNRSYYNSVYCSATQLADFVSWIEEQPFFENTTVIIVGDHISMQNNLYPEDTNRRIYNLFINSSVKEGNFYNRSFCTMDFFPTTLASLGAKIEGDRLGLGTNLFSNKKTLIEEYGHDEFNEKISGYSKYYMKDLLYEKS